MNFQKLVLIVQAPAAVAHRLDRARGQVARDQVPVARIPPLQEVVTLGFRDRVGSAIVTRPSGHPGAAVVATSAKTGQGLDELRAALAALAGDMQPVHAAGATRLFVDRVFTLHGIGTVATGTAVGGELAHDGYDARCLFADGTLLTASPSPEGVREARRIIDEGRREAGRISPRATTHSRFRTPR